MAHVIGLTGSFGSGKSTVAGMFTREGAKLIDADQLAAQALQPGQPAYYQTVERFGDRILDCEGRIRRDELARQVFNDRQALRRLEQIIHPVVRRETERLIHEFTNERLIVLDIPLLLEAGMADQVDSVVVVTVRENQRFFRLKASGLNESQIVARLGNQMSQDRKVRLADFVIDNSGSIEKTRQQINQILNKIYGVKTERT